jgi:hypothetical protein
VVTAWPRGQGCCALTMSREAIAEEAWREHIVLLIRPVARQLAEEVTGGHRKG